MRRVNVRKRGKVYQYQFEIGTINGKRKFINKSGFKTQNEAYAAEQLAYEKYINGGVTFKQSQMLYSDYLDYWSKARSSDKIPISIITHSGDTNTAV